MSRYKLHIFLFLTLSSGLHSCLSFDSQLQTGRLVKRGQYLVTVAGHILLEHEEDVAAKRLRNDFSDDLDTSQPHTGLNVIIRRGINSYADLGLNISLGDSSVEPRASLFSGERFASAIGAKWLFRTNSIDEPHLHRIKLGWYNSVELLPTFALYVVPHWESKPFGETQEEWRGVSAGIVLGKENAWILESSYAVEVKGESPQSYEQVKLGYSFGLDKLQDKLETDEWSKLIKVMPQISVKRLTVPSLGLVSRYVFSDDWQGELSLDFGLGPVPSNTETKSGYVSFRSYAFKGRYAFYEPYTFKAGLARHEIRAHFELLPGWHDLTITNHGVELSFGQTFKAWQVDWVQVYAPLPFLPHSGRFRDADGDHQALPSGLELWADRYENKLALSLLAIHYEY
ncbi:MAG: hypothetical protein HYW48_00145 [Deltaproteobacteria bacterium]|nr:hypothetical protein [Deltaproteobacteria bacterium]